VLTEKTQAKSLASMLMDHTLKSRSNMRVAIVPKKSQKQMQPVIEHQN